VATLFGSARASASIRSSKSSWPPLIRIGTHTLRRCSSAPTGYCGTLAVPLDWGVPGGPRIRIAFTFYPATDRRHRALGTVVPVEGGPGYSSVNSVDGGYSAMYGTILRSRNLLAIDNRGTGASTPIDCPALQNFSRPTATRAFQKSAAACAARLNHRWRYRNGSWVHASDLFNSAPAAEDLAAVITALKLNRIDLYGDSYGSFFAQVFASRFPQLLRSVVLDSTYQTLNLDPWYRSTITSMPAAFNAVCRRTQACAAIAPGSSWTRLRALAARVRRHPISGKVPGSNGTIDNVSMRVTGLVDLLTDAAGDPGIYRAIDASARALLQDRNPAPLLRLYAQRLANDEAYFGLPASEYSVGLYLAASCLDYPQLFSMSATPRLRAAELAQAVALLPGSTFGPFTTAEWLAQDQNSEAYTACLDWPAPTVAQRPIAGAPPLLPASMPVLVLGGELDSLTPPAGVPAVLSQLGGRSRFIEVANATHVVGENNTPCGSTLVKAFVLHPQAIGSLDASCAKAAPPIQAVGIYPGRLSAAPASHPPAKGTASPRALHIPFAAVFTAEDAIARYEAIGATVDHGLFGGVIRANAAGTLLTLTRDQLVPGVAISGNVRITATNSSRGDVAAATLTVTARGLPLRHIHRHLSHLRAEGSGGPGGPERHGGGPPHHIRNQRP
jgi:pimeloyl-ACP methyl ester carboxylesterase